MVNARRGVCDLCGGSYRERFHSARHGTVHGYCKWDQCVRSWRNKRNTHRWLRRRPPTQQGSSASSQGPPLPFPPAAPLPRPPPPPPPSVPKSKSCLAIPKDETFEERKKERTHAQTSCRVFCHVSSQRCQDGVFCRYPARHQCSSCSSQMNVFGNFLLRSS